MQKAVKSCHASKTTLDAWTDHCAGSVRPPLDGNEYYHPGIGVDLGASASRGASGYHPDTVVQPSDEAPDGCTRPATHT